MGLFKSDREKTLQALQDTARACAQEADEKFKRIIDAYGKGTIKNDPYIPAFIDLYQSLYGRAVMAENEYGPPLMYEVRTDLMGIFTRACKYYIYLNLMITQIRKGGNKYLSREALTDLERYVAVCEKYICKLYPAGPGYDEKVDTFVFGKVKNGSWADYRSVQRLFEEKMNLVEVE